MPTMPLIEKRFEPADRNQLEFNLTYLIHPGARHQRYVAEMYLFVPRILGLDQYSYHANDFFTDMAAFLRLKTPTVPLKKLGSAKTTARRKRLIKLLRNPDMDDAEAVRLLKLVACIFRSACWARARPVIVALDAGSAVDKARLIAVADEIAAARAQLAELAPLACGLPDGQEGICETWAAADEYTSLVTQNVCTALVQAIDRHPKSRSAARARFTAIAVEQAKYRRAMGYLTVLEEGVDNEAFVYQRRILQHTVRSVLYLDARPDDRAAQLAADLVGMVAAAIAMLFAVLAAMYAQLEWQNSWPFVIAMVFSYMVKDRIKEWGRRMLGLRARRFLPDRVSRVRDLSGTVIGRCAEYVRVVDPDVVDVQVIARRHERHPTSLSEDGRPESVIHYCKRVTLEPALLGEAVHGTEGLNDIIRLSLRRFRERMDARVEEHAVVDPDTGEVRMVKCARVYHLHAVLRLSVLGDQARTTEEHVLVVLDQKGIRRMEPVLPPESPQGLSAIAGHRAALAVP